MDFNDNAFAEFLQLDDVKAEYVNTLEAKDVIERSKAKPEPEEEITDFDVDDDFDGIDWEAALLNKEFEDEETDEAEDDDQSKEKEASDDSEVDGEEDNEPEAVDVDLDTLITLPNGTSLTIEELQNGYAEQTAVQEQRAQVMDMLSKFEAAKAESSKMMELSLLECDKALQAYATVDLKRMIKENPAEFARHHEYIEATKAKRAELVQELQIQEERNKQAEYEQYVQQCTACRQVLEHDIPEWSNELYQELMQFAVDSGVSEEDIVKENRPSFFKMAYKAMKYEKGESLAKKAKVKRVGAPSAVVSSSSTKKSDSLKERKLAAYKQGKLSNADVFSLIED